MTDVDEAAWTHRQTPAGAARVARPPASGERFRDLLAAGIAGGDVSASGIARFASVSLAEASKALQALTRSGLVNPDGTVDPGTAADLVEALPQEVVAEIHGRAARYWMTTGPEHLLKALNQMRAAGSALPVEELIDLADHAGQMSLSLLDYPSAAELLRVAVELDSGQDPAGLGRRLCDLAIALDGLGDVTQARQCLVRAATLGEYEGDGELVARAAVAGALPVDWYAGDERSSALLDRASRMTLSDSSRIQIKAARGLCEMRVPISSGDGQQLAWLTRPSVAQSLTEEALEESEGHDPKVRALTTLAWRTTHRGPAFLERRRAISRESLDLAQITRLPSYQVESAVWLAVDALESVDRGLYDEALSVARWVAMRDSNPRLIWRSHTLAAGSAHIDGSLDEAEMWRSKAREVGSSVLVPGWLAADFLLLGEWVVAQDDPSVLEQYLLDESFPALVNPIGRALAAFVHARVGDPAVARRMVDKTLRQLDTEASYLLQITRCAAVAEQLGDVELARQIAPLLDPWRGRVAVDSNGWFCDGPVDRWLASMQSILGVRDSFDDLLSAAQGNARELNDARTLSYLSTREWSTRAPRQSRIGTKAEAGQLLTARQREVFRLMSTGLTNPQIAARLAFSTSTVRVETMAIYRLLGVKSRTEAVAKGAALGLVESSH